MHLLDSFSTAFLRVIFLAFGLTFGFFWLLAFSMWSMETWALSADLGALLVVPIVTLLVGILYLAILVKIIFKSSAPGHDFVKQVLLLFLALFVSSVVFFIAADRVYSIPFLRITNAPLSIFDHLTLESKLGFKPLLPTQSFPRLESSWRSISHGTLELTFLRGSANVKISQATEFGTSSVVEWCREREKNSDEYITVPITIAGQDTLLYYPETVDPEHFYSYCVPLEDRVIYASAERGRALVLDDLIFWLKNLK